MCSDRRVPARSSAPASSSQSSAEPTLAELGEDGVLARILARIPSAGAGAEGVPGAGAAVEVGPGDDAAVTALPGHLVSSADMLVEGEDFLRGWLDPRRLGIKAGAQNLADICAMGAAPTGLLLSLAAPGDTPAAVLEGIVEGLVEEAGRAGAAVLGGDLSGAGQLVVAVTSLGGLDPRLPALTRDAARPGDVLWLGGRTGWAAAGLDLLLASGAALPCTPECAACCAEAVEAQRAPRPDYPAVDRLREALGHAREGAGHGRHAALIDLSDGLHSDAGRIARASGAVLDLDGEALRALAGPLVPVAAHVLAVRGDIPATDPAALALHWVLTGGEDHGFLAAAPPEAVPVGWARIGRVLPGEPEVRVDGAPAVHGTGGFRHFRAPEDGEDVTGAPGPRRRDRA